MSVEDFKSFENKNPSPLETFFRKMDEEDQHTIEMDVFNTTGGVPIENALSSITDIEEARIVMRSFSEYLKDREFLSREQRLVRAEEMHDYIDRRI